jgi:hypothetical protein
MISESLQVIPFDNAIHRKGGKVMLPENILGKLFETKQNLDETPIYLQITCVDKKTEDIQISYVGILQFDYKTEANCITLPDWIISQSRLDTGDFIFVENCQMTNIKEVLIKNIIGNIYEISDYQMVLQDYFSHHFICLQENMHLSLNHNNSEYEFIVCSLKDNDGNFMDHGSIHDVDLEVNIEDYFEKPQVVPAEPTRIRDPVEPKPESSPIKPNPIPIANIPAITDLQPKPLDPVDFLKSRKQAKYTPREVYHAEGFVPFSGGGYALGTK